MSKKRWIIFAVITAAILGFLVLSSNSSRVDVSKIDINTIQASSDQNGDISDHIFGKTGSKVTLIEYGDYQCPGCGAVNPSIVAITEQYKDQLQFVFRNFPLSSVHANAKAAAAAAEAAGLQEKYWEMHNKIYAGQSDWENLTGDARTNAFTKYATDLSLDTTKFSTDIASSAISSKIDFDYALGLKAGVDSTPSFFLDGTKLDSAVWSNNTKFQEAINAELTKAGIALPKQ